MNDLFRLYGQDEIGPDGYPPIWHLTLKHEVREQAGHRCIRCGHPYHRGEHGKGEWTPCDKECRHKGPYRVMHLTQRERPLYWFDVPSDECLDVPVDNWCLGDGGDKYWAVEARWRILTVHHLDGNKANCRWWNLCALDQRCHLTIQGRVRMERAYRGEHSDWFKPYAAGYYAWRFLCEDLTRGEVDARLDELLALEDRQLSLGTGG